MKQTKYNIIVNSTIEAINSGSLTKGDSLPSINQICQKYKVSRDTTQKAYAILKERGIAEPVHGKAFVVLVSKVEVKQRIFLLFDTLSPYKNTLLQSIKESFGDKVFIDIYFHHYNADLFLQLVEHAKGSYTSYIIMPFENQTVLNGLEVLPIEKLYLLDRKPESNIADFNGIVQDFESDIQNVLTGVIYKVLNYKKMVLAFHNTITEVPIGLKRGFISFCEKNSIKSELITERITPEHIEKNTAYIVIDDEDLVSLIEGANRNQFALGRDIGIISYNETPLKKIIGTSGVSVISTDFTAMGMNIANSIKSSTNGLMLNDVNFIDRNSF